MEILEGVKWQTSQVNYNGPKQQCIVFSWSLSEDDSVSDGDGEGDSDGNDACDDESIRDGDGEGGDEIDDVQGRLPLSLGRTIKSCSLPLLAGSGWGGELSISAWQCDLMDDDDID